VIGPVTHVISEFSVGLNAGASLQQGLVAGPDGTLWFTDSGTTRAIGMINPGTHAISEFSTGLNAGSGSGASIVVGPEAVAARRQFDRGCDGAVVYPDRRRRGP